MDDKLQAEMDVAVARHKEIVTMIVFGTGDYLITDAAHYDLVLKCVREADTMWITHENLIADLGELV